MTLVGTLLGGSLTALVATHTARSTQRQQLELEDRRVEREDYRRVLEKREELYVRFLQAGKDVEVLLNRYADPSETDRAGLVAKTKDRVTDFDKLAQEVELYASSRVSAGIDQLVQAWHDWLSAGDTKHGRDHVRQEAKAQYRAMSVLMRAEVGPPQTEVTNFQGAGFKPHPLPPGNGNLNVASPRTRPCLRSAT
jgi:hypothetical protein